MHTAQTILETLKSKGKEKTRILYGKHGLPTDRMFGVSIADLKAIAKTIKRQQALALDLYATGNLDAMYLAGIVADGKQMTKDQIQAWAEGAEGMQMISEYTVPWVATENPEGRRLAMEWIKSRKEHLATSGWCTYAGLVSMQPDEALDLAEIEELLEFVALKIDGAKNRVRLTMNGFVISVGGYVVPLNAKAKATARRLGEVKVDMGDNACKVPLATSYIEKIESMGRMGQKKKTIRC
jgi:3-methyladenine DNA glycosylase AlkD